MPDEYSPRQLCALLVTALSAPLAVVCSAVGWVWTLAAVGVAALFYLYIGAMARLTPPGMGYAALLKETFGARAGAVLAAAYWIWLALSAARAARMAETAFPLDRAFPLIPLALLLLAALVAAKDTAAACRFGGVLFLFVAALLGFTLVFGAGDVRWENLRPAGEARDLCAPLAILLTPASALFLRDGLNGQKRRYARWFLLAAALAAALSVVCVGALGEPLARASVNAFWLMSRSVSVLGVMERFEALISALLSLGFCCLLVLLLCAARRAARAAAQALTGPGAAWLSAAAAAAVLWPVSLVPDRLFLVGTAIFWGIMPGMTLGIAGGKKFRKREKKG